MKLKAVDEQYVELPQGISSLKALPDSQLAALWDSIIIEPALRTRLLSQAVLNFTIRGRISREDLPLHGVLLMTGLPGTGKTSLAKGLANKVAQTFPKHKFNLIEVDPHSLTSSAMGKTQKATSDLLAQTISEYAMAGPTIVILDEVETLAVDRSRLSMDANPIDIHRATDAVLVQLDSLAEKYPQLLFIATSNFPDAIDDAFTSRCDLVINIPLPNKTARLAILQSCLAGIGQTFPGIAALAKSKELSKCANECEGLDGRTIRKLVASAMASSAETALDPNKLKISDLIETAKQTRLGRADKEGRS